MAATMKKIKGEEMSACEEMPACEEAVAILDPAAKIAELAYYKAEKRGFEPGHEMEDWLAAEQELNL